MSQVGSLPPGPRLAMVAQTAIWFRHAQWMLGQCVARFGETFTLRIVHEGTGVVLSNPERVKQVFSGDSRVFHAGEGNRLCRSMPRPARPASEPVLRRAITETPHRDAEVVLT